MGRTWTHAKRDGARANGSGDGGGLSCPPDDRDDGVLAQPYIATDEAVAAAACDEGEDLRREHAPPSGLPRRVRRVRAALAAARRRRGDAGTRLQRGRGGLRGRGHGDGRGRRPIDGGGAGSFTYAAAGTVLRWWTAAGVHLLVFHLPGGFDRALAGGRRQDILCAAWLEATGAHFLSAMVPAGGGHRRDAPVLNLTRSEEKREPLAGSPLASPRAGAAVKTVPASGSQAVG